MGQKLPASAVPPILTHARPLMFRTLIIRTRLITDGNRRHLLGEADKGLFTSSVQAALGRPFVREYQLQSHHLQLSL